MTKAESPEPFELNLLKLGQQVKVEEIKAASEQAGKIGQINLRIILGNSRIPDFIYAYYFSGTDIDVPRLEDNLIAQHTIAFKDRKEDGALVELNYGYIGVISFGKKDTRPLIVYVPDNAKEIDEVKDNLNRSIDKLSKEELSDFTRTGGYIDTVLRFPKESAERIIRITSTDNGEIGIFDLLHPTRKRSFSRDDDNASDKLYRNYAVIYTKVCKPFLQDYTQQKPNN